MINTRRHKRLLKLLDERGQASTEDLMAWLPASAATVRRDLAWLAQHQQLVRVRGGAHSLRAQQQQHQQQSHEAALLSPAFGEQLTQHVAQKRAIARYAASLCRRGDTVIINGGSTTFMMADELPRTGLRILTNSFLLAQQLLAAGDNQIILPGGSIYREHQVILSPFENDVAQHHYAAKMFMSVHGLSALGLMEADPLLVQAERRLIAQAEALIVLADSSKFSRRTGLVLCGMERVQQVITDTAAPDGAVQWLERQGVRVVCVDAADTAGMLHRPHAVLTPARPGAPAA